MKMNTPITPEEHAAADEEHMRIVMKQKKYLRELADKLEDGEPISQIDSQVIAEILRDRAGRMNTSRPRPKGKPAKIPDTFPHLLQAYMESCRFESENKAFEYFAELYGVSITALKNRLDHLPESEKDLLKLFSTKT